jgi:hypothetical protein
VRRSPGGPSAGEKGSRACQAGSFRWVELSPLVPGRLVAERCVEAFRAAAFLVPNNEPVFESSPPLR